MKQPACYFVRIFRGSDLEWFRECSSQADSQQACSVLSSIAVA